MKRTTPHRLLAFFLAICLLFSLTAVVSASSAVPTEAQAYQRMIALQPTYPEGMTWTNDNYYAWKGGIFSVGYGCAAFAFLLSDAVFGDLPARIVYSVKFSDVKVGDILRINNDTHAVIVLKVNDYSVTVAEGNYNGTVHWDRTLDANKVAQSDYLITRWPENLPEPVDAMKDVKHDWTREGINYCLKRGLMNGTGAATFAPDLPTSRGMIVTILHRLEGEPSAPASTFSDVPAGQFYTKAVGWASANGIVTGGSDGLFHPNDPITREQLAAIFQRYAKYKGYRTTQRADLSVFSDAGSISSYARDALSWANAVGLINGSGSAIMPRGGASRAQTAAILMRWCQSHSA